MKPLQAYLITGAILALTAGIMAMFWMNRALTNQTHAGVSSIRVQPIVQEEEPYYDIGGFHYPATSDSNQAQLWFDRGLAMCVAFNHEEAVRCFQNAISADPGMAMANWGLAYALGPNINNMEITPQQMARAEMALTIAKQQAKQGHTELEQKLIDTLAVRHPTPIPEDLTPLHQQYASAMRDLYQAYPQDPWVNTLFIESLMLLRPWNHWSKDGQPAPETPEIVKTLETALDQWPDHPALCHFYIHVMEASPDPGKALPAANRLRDAMPGAGHLVHMPSHIDVLLGNYERVIEANRKAIELDNEFLKREGPYNFYTLYRIHNYHFLVYGAMFDGQRELALQTARALKDQVPEAMLKEQVDFLDAFMPIDFHVMVRFGMWEEILQAQAPADYLPVAQATRHYARAIAFAATGRVEQAESEQARFAAVKETVPETSFLFNNASNDILGVAEAMIAGEIAYRKGEFDAAFTHLEEAVRRDDQLNYDEPWGWMQPARHALAALLLEQNRLAESELVYREDLKRRPKNPWSLHGLTDCLKQQGKNDEAEKYAAAFAKASERADITIDRSCFCKLK